MSAGLSNRIWKIILEICNWDTPESQSELAGVNSNELEKTRWRVTPRLHQRACGRGQQCVLVCPCPSPSLFSASRAVWLGIQPKSLSLPCWSCWSEFPTGLSTGMWEKGHKWLCWHMDEEAAITLPVTGRGECPCGHTSFVVQQLVLLFKLCSVPLKDFVQMWVSTVLRSKKKQLKLLKQH